MKKIITIALALFGCSLAMAYDNYDNRRIYKDVYNHSYKNEQTLDKDSDGDGVSNRYDYNDRNKNIQFKGQVDYTKPLRRNSPRY